MANVFISLAVPVSDGVGAAIDVSTIAPIKTFVVNSSKGSGVVLIEASENDIDYFSIGRVDTSSPKNRPIQFVGVLKSVRVRRVFTNSDLPLPTVTMGAEDTTTVQVFGVLDVSIDNGAGVPFDSSTGGNLLTFSTTGYLTKGFLIVEGSQDAGVTFNELARFDSPWNSNQRKSAVIIGSFSILRTRREKTLPDDIPGIQFGQGEDSQGGGGGGGPGSPPPPIVLLEAPTVDTPLLGVPMSQEFWLLLTGNRIMGIPTNPVPSQVYVYRIQNDNGTREITWIGGIGGFLFGLSIPEINIVLGTGGANSYDYVSFKYDFTLQRHVCVGFLAGYV